MQAALALDGTEASNDGLVTAPDAPDAAQGQQREPRRSRDRYGRDRRDREGRPEQAAEAGVAPEATVEPQPTGDEQERRPRYATGFVDEADTREVQRAPAGNGADAPIERSFAEAPRERAVPAAIAPIATQPAPAAPAGLPKVQPFALPIDDLDRIAQSSGLQWVNSDAGKIAAVQAAIAAEPKPIRVPRERPPEVVIDEGPLVLVETRRDLRDVKLPFEQQPPSSLQ